MGSSSGVKKNDTLCSPHLSSGVQMFSSYWVWFSNRMVTTSGDWCWGIMTCCPFFSSLGFGTSSLLWGLRAAPLRAARRDEEKLPSGGCRLGICRIGSYIASTARGRRGDSEINYSALKIMNHSVSVPSLSATSGYSAVFNGRLPINTAISSATLPTITS